ncbi:MAG TPA: amino acid adenylation domain-containing protein [Nostocaceae cyanobacterium]|nr:amino acid adenylation domain-containing protein [Nostocaceae cyanobacterium]
MLTTIEGFELSPQQKYLWHLQTNSNCVYNSVCAVEITGNLQIEVLKTAVTQVVDTYEILRTNYRQVQGMNVPLQFINQQNLIWHINEDVNNLSPLFDRLIQIKFDLEQSEILYLSLVKVTNQKHIFIIALPALSADKVTLHNIVQEISANYAQLVNHQQTLNSEILQYADLAAWQNELLTGEDTQAGREYWQNLDYSAITTLQLPFTKPIQNTLEFHPQTYNFPLNHQLREKINYYIQTQGISINQLLFTCWNILIWKLTAQQNLILGFVVDGRSHPELQPALGLLSKTLPIHLYIQEENTFIELLQQIQNKISEATTYGDYFQLDYQKSNPEFIPLSFESVPSLPQYKYADVCFTINQQYVQTDRYNIKLITHEDAINLEFAYDANLFVLDDIQNLADQFCTLITNAIDTPKQQISQLTILNSTLKQKLLLEFNHTQTNYQKNQCIHQLFTEQVINNPDQIALISEIEKITYLQLDQLTNKIAHYLRKLGVGAEVLVGLCVERSPLMILGILGILKAGGAYVPLDPNYPKERLTFMLQNSQPKILLTQKHLSHELQTDTAEIVCLDKIWHIIAQESAENLLNLTYPENLAYVIYTSGSTGKPKGVRVTHANLCHYVQAMQKALGITANDIYLHTASLAFSSSVRQLIVPLTKGATVKIATQEQRHNPLALFQGIKQDNVTVIDIVPSYWRNCNYVLANLSAETRKEILDNQLRLIVSASEPLLSDIPHFWHLNLNHQTQFINMFGQTETCGIVATYPIKITAKNLTKIVPLGQPIANTQIYLLDQNLQPVPIGVIGELYIGGWGVGQGYLHRPDLTAERFIPNPYSQEPGTRLYKTGDLGRYLADGTIEFIGRIDYQVKIRGFRIELGEIEAQLTQHPQIREAVVIAKEKANQDKYLVAYLVPNNAENIDLSELNNFLKQNLPDYMLPSIFAILEALPLTPNGKVNRQALPAPEELNQRKKGKFIVPSTPVEEVLAGIWAKILGVQQIGVEDNFFELGGHSLLATQVISHIRETFKIELPLRNLFEYPTLAALADRIEIELRNEQKISTIPIEKVSRSGNLPLSFAQQRLWFLDQFQSGNTVYNLTKAIKFTGELNITALEQSFNKIIRRHEVLRTAFHSVDGQPVQVILPEVKIKLSVIDLQYLPPAQQKLEQQHWLKIQARHNFDLTTAPLFNICLLQLGKKEYLLLFTIHHIIADGWSSGVIIRELVALYESFCLDKPCILANLPIQYADFAVWQKTHLQTQAFTTQLEYWRQQLSGDLPILELPIAKPRPQQPSYSGKKENFQLSLALTNELKILSQKQGVTLFMTLLAGFQTLLYRYTGQEDILIGSPIANRNRKEIEGLIGCFVNTVVLRTQIAGNPSFQDLLQQVREVTLGAYTHQDLPFELLVEELQPQRSINHTPLFQVMFALQNAPGETLQLPGLSGEYLQVDGDTSRFDFSLAFTETPQGLIGELEYNTDLFDADDINQMVKHLEVLLTDITVNCEKTISELSLLTPSEQQQILIEWNQTNTEYPDLCVHELFTAQVQRTPNAVAVVAGDEQITYEELEQKSNQLANYLQSLGIGSEMLVGVLCDRTLSMITVLLAIVKSGAAYIPLDPSFPPDRLAFMLEDSQTPFLLTQQHLLPFFPPHSAQVICLDSDWCNIATQPHTPPNTSIQPENLIYTIYTSGSTGNPKGVQITHSNVVNFLTGMQQKLQLTSQDHLLSVTTLSFDIATLEIFLPLTVGAKVTLASREIATDGIKLLEKLNNSHPTIMQATPATWRMLLDAGWQGNKQLKILCGGEALPQNLAAQLHQKAATIWNVYGPTETTIWSTIHQLNPQEKTISIGRPLANTQIYILDKHLQPVPPGIPGELHIGGLGLARGYLNRPELTTEKFIPNPFQPNTLIYKTGDLARYLPNGEIEYLGRIDYQVKLRGFRIELGEIETLLEQHPDVQQCVVIVREDIPGNQRLVAYLVAENRIIPELNQYLRKKLPEYMIPSAFITLNTIPLTPNGKVNRRALPAPENTHQLTNNFTAPRSPIEEILAAIWSQILSISPIGINDNFFALGGHSLLATQVISRIRKTLNVDISLQDLFTFPTIAEITPVIQKANNQDIISIKPVNRNGNLPLSFAQGRLWLLQQLNPDSYIYNMPAAVRLSGELNVDILEQSINEIIRRHEVLRTTFILENDQPLQVILPQIQINIPVINLQELTTATRETEIQRLSIEEFQLPFNFTQAPLFRCKLLQLDPQEHILLFTIHHIVFDGWSIGVLIRELAAIYRAFIAGKPSPLPELFIQYADFAAWQRQQLQGEKRTALLNYWQQQLANLTVLKLPTIRPRSEVKTNWGASLSFIIPATVAKELKQLSQQENVTLFMTLLASFKILLQRYTNQDDIIVGTDVANRNLAEIEPLIGFFINLLVLRTDLSGNPTFTELLQRVRTQTLSAYSHQDLPFDELVRELQPDRSLSHTSPLFQVLFVLQNTPTSILELPGLTLDLLPVETKTARFDLALFLTETTQGIAGKWQYNADLFAKDIIERMTNNWQTLLNNIVQQPQNRINTLEILTIAEKSQQTMQQQERKAAKKQKFMNIAPKAVNLSVENLIKTKYLQPEQKFPLIIQPHTSEIDLISWAENNLEYLETELLKHGAILFRDFQVKSALEFEKFAQTICPNLFGEYGDLPRTGEGGKVYGSTPYPADKAILLHNESSHLHCFPLKIWFYCVQPAEEGGETPIVDCRKAYKLLSSQLREKLATKQLMYVRNYAEGLDVSWQNFFQTTDKQVVENYCLQAGIEFEWYNDNGLVTRQIRPALAVHPKTGESVFFNQIQLHHISYLDTEVRNSLLSIFGESKLPRNVYFGDGTAISDSEIAEINEVYEQSKISFPWQKGDIIMLDNMLAAHGRNPFLGQRKIVVAMGNMINSSSVIMKDV